MFRKIQRMATKSWSEMAPFPNVWCKTPGVKQVIGRGFCGSRIFRAGLFVVSLCVFLLASHAFANHAEGQVILLSADVGEATQADSGQLRGVLSAALSESDRPMTVFRRSDVQSLFQQRHSSATAELAPDELASLRECADRALVEVGNGRHVQAQETVAECLAIGQRALETLNRATDAAKTLFDACLYVVRARHELGDAEGALSEAMRCRRLVPDIQPSDRDHPPYVREVVAEADRLLERSVGAELNVEVASGVACPVFVNGRRLGEAPVSLQNLPTGTYRVQVDCDGRHSRTHVANVDDDPVNLVIDLEFDRAVRTQDGLSLVYEDTMELASKQAEHGLAVGRILGAVEVWVLSHRERGRRLDRLVVGTGHLAAYALLPSEGDIPAEAVQSLLSGRSMNFRGGSGVEIEAVTDDEIAGASNTGPETPSWLGWVGAGLTLAAYGASWTTWGLQKYAGDRFRLAELGDPDFIARQSSYLDASGLFLPLAVTSAVLGTVTVPFFAPEADGIPWHAWLAGGIGLVAVGAGAWLQGEEECTEEFSNGLCHEGTEGESVGLLLMLHAPPFLAVPLTYLVRDLTGNESTQASVRFDGHGFEASVGGNF